jgi:hypothetical protein
MQPSELPPPRFGNWNGNIELANGAKFPNCYNAHFEYYQRLIRQHRMNPELERKVEEFDNREDLYHIRNELSGQCTKELKDWLRTALQEAYELGRKEEREHILQNAKEDDTGMYMFYMSKD